MKCTTDDSRMAHARKKRGAKDAAGAAAKCFSSDSEWFESLLINQWKSFESLLPPWCSPCSFFLRFKSVQ